jgi:hypothetical protein
MTDRELLEAAAKAAGIDLSAADWGGERDGFYWVIYGQTGRVDYWNPLTDSGDAFELAVKLRLTLNCSYDEVAICGQEFTQKEVFIEYNKEDANAATRRAIVRAAAELGKAL